MSEWKIGDWFRRKAVGNTPSEIFRFICQDNFDKDCGRYIDSERSFWTHSYSLMEHLPDCNSFDWQPTLQLREGAWYERADGKIVGPLRYDNEFYRAGGYFYGSNGIAPGAAGYNLVREAPAPAPKYRPFANAAEFAPHRDRWLRRVHPQAIHGIVMGRCINYSDSGIVTCMDGVVRTFAESLEKLSFDDDGTPFGVEVTE